MAWLLCCSPAVARSLVVDANGLNLRASPGGAVLCKLADKSLLEQESPPKNGWVKVKSTSGGCKGTGFVSAKYVDAHEAAAKTVVREAGAHKVPLVVTQRYNPKGEPGRGFSQFTSSLGLLAFGNLYRATSLDLEKMLLEKLSLPELKPYFPSERERKNLAAKISYNINRNYLNRGMTNSNVIGATRYAAEELLGLVIHRAMAKEGVKSGDRRSLWAKKIMSPFRVCMSNARTYQEGNKCLDAAQEDAVKNIGLGIAYEMIRQEMGPGYTNSVGRDYHKCLNLRRAGADDRVKGCVLASMRNGAADFGIDKVREAAAKDAPDSADSIAKLVRPAFSKCLAKASERKGFARCADELIAKAGGEIAAAAVMNNEHVKTYYPVSKERQELADNGKGQFIDCMEKNQDDGKRDESGNLSTENCAQQVRLETARAVAHALIDSNVEKMKDLKSDQQKEIKKTVGKQLDGCWDSRSTDEKNNACMKDSIESLVGSIAEIKLANSIPPALNAKEPKLKGKLVEFVRSCIQRDLPDDVMHSSDAAERVDGCAAKLLKEAALKVAAFELRQVMHGKTSDEDAADSLVKKLVDKDLYACLGGAPTDEILSKCTAHLKKSAAISAGELLFREEFERFVQSNGGIEELEISTQEKDSFLSQTLATHSLCLDEKVKKEENVDRAVDGCFKSSIHSLASYLGRLAFQKNSREHISDRASLLKFLDRFGKDLSLCLQEKNDPKYNLNDYVANIDVCANRLTITYTTELGSRQLTDALMTNLPGPELASRRESMQKQLMGNFSTCIQKSGDKTERDNCVAGLKREATKEITILTAREQAKSHLNGGQPPKEFDEAEQKLQACLDKGKNPDTCARQHAQNVAKILGSLKLKVSLGSALGGDKLKESGRTIASLESGFFSCVDSIPGDKPDAAFMKALKACGEAMENKGVAFVQKNLNDWMQSPGASALELVLRNDAANAIPCLGPILPSGPISEDALQKMNPEGMLQSVAEVVGNYINYDAKKADLHFDKLLQQVITDLEAAGPIEARENLLDLLIKGGMVDQLLKSMVRSQVRKALSGLPAEDQLSPELQAALLDPRTLEEALSPEVMAKLRPFMADQLLKPLLIQGKTFEDPKLAAAMKSLEKQVALTLIHSEAFGDRLVSGAVQKQINTETSGLTGWIGSWYYSYDWNEIRRTENGRAAEAYVRDNVIRPLVLGEKLSDDEIRRRRSEASRLVTSAVKSQ